jgi:putative endonuclease
MNHKKIPTKREIGTQYEEKAAKYLEGQGYQILDKNVNYRWGEIDLVTIDPSENDLVFVEVRSRGENAMVTPAESITYSKQLRLTRAIQTYLASPQGEQLARKLKGIRIDLIGFDREVVSHWKSFM